MPLKMMAKCADRYAHKAFSAAGLLVALPFVLALCVGSLLCCGPFGPIVVLLALIAIKSR